MARSVGKPLERGATNRLAYIDAVRGFAALWVFLLHIHGYWLDNVRPPTLSFDGLVVKAIAFGGAGVDIFMCSPASASRFRFCVGHAVN